VPASDAEEAALGLRRPTQGPDALLLSFLRAATDEDAEHLLANLVRDHAEPLIQRILRAKLRADHGLEDAADALELEDIEADTLLRIVSRLSELRTEPDAEPLHDFTSYVAVAAYNAFHGHLRRKYPERWRLKNRIRYTLTHREGLAIWQDRRGVSLCGFAAWRDQDLAVCAPHRLQHLRDDPEALEPQGVVEGARHGVPTQLLTAIFRQAAAPVALDALVALVATLVGCADRPPQPPHGPQREPPAAIAAPGDALERVDKRHYLQRLWEELTALPVLQRRALLLNLRDGDGRDMTSVLAETRIATLRDIAAALALPSEELAQLLHELPLDDKTIAAHLGVTRQQVINLRSSARRRLTRRMHAFAMP
jgi:hypothetical protein